MTHEDDLRDRRVDSQESDGGVDPELSESESRFPHKLIHPRMRRFRFYPRLSTDVIKELVSTLGFEWYDRRYGHELLRYRVMVFAGAPLYVFLFVAVLLYGWRLPFLHSRSVVDHLLFAAIVSFLIDVVWVSRMGGARRRFFRSIGAALRSLEGAVEEQESGWLRFKPLYEGSLVATFNFVGGAARALFVSLQRSRRTWIAPPTIAERAIRLSRPLIDIEIIEDFDITHDGDIVKFALLYTFLQDVAAVVAIRREDLIPAVRSLYEELPVRSVDDGESRKRDIRYLDPMNERSRWEVVKDFVLPLSSWLSLAVSITALVISITK